MKNNKTINKKKMNIIILINQQFLIEIKILKMKIEKMMMMRTRTIKKNNN